MRLKTPPSNASNLVRFGYFGLFQLGPVMFTIAPVTVADPMPPPSAGSRKMQLSCTDAEVVGKIDQLLNTQTFSEIAATLNKNGFRSGKGQRFTPRYIARIQKQYVLRSRFDRLRALGLPTLNEMAGVLSVHPKTVKTWVAHGLLKAHAYTDKPEHLYEPLGPVAIAPSAAR